MSHRLQILATYHFLLCQGVIATVVARSHEYPYETSQLPECLIVSQVACGIQLSLLGSYRYPECLGETWTLSYNCQVQLGPSLSIEWEVATRTLSYSFQVQPGPSP